MKKILLFALAAFLIVAYAMPVMAKVHMGGIVFTDAVFIKNNEFFQRNTAVDRVANDASRSWFDISVPVITRLYGKWVNDTGDVGMHIELGIEGEEADGGGGGEWVATRHAYGWWQINPMFKLTAGQQSGVVSAYGPSQLLGAESHQGAVGHPTYGDVGYHVGLTGFGNIAPDRQEGLRLDTKLGEKTSLAICLFTPNINGAQVDVAGAAVWGRPDEEETLPRIDIALFTSLGAFSMAPSFSWERFNYEHDQAALANNWDDSDWDAWLWSIPVKFAPGGPITVTAELNWGENLGDGSWNAGTTNSVAAAGQLSNGIFPMGAGCGWDRIITGSGLTRVVADTEYFGGWVNLAWKAHPMATVHLFYGYQRLNNDDLSAAISWDQTSTAYGISVPITVAKRFVIRPEAVLYDYGEFEVNGVVNPATGPLGKQTLIGVQFQIVF
jgi:hypothetical protein